ncbi:MAG: hypothetical protein O3C63_08255, partial [Cyanobacteria bacterium]|nr:hypothetical protein [Cyanobacteriota bacterium]
LFAEVKFNTKLIEAGLIVEQIGVDVVDQKPLLINADGSDALADIDLQDPRTAYTELVARVLLDPLQANPRMIRFSNTSPGSEIIYFDRDNGDLVFNKNHKERKNPRLTIVQSDKSLSSFNFDAIAKDPDLQTTLYIEHKINLSTFVKKNKMVSAKHQQSQLANFLAVATAHKAKPVIMMDLSEAYNNDATINPQNHLIQAAKAIIQETVSQKPSCTRPLIFDSNANEVSTLFGLAA